MRRLAIALLALSLASAAPAQAQIVHGAGNATTDAVVDPSSAAPFGSPVADEHVFYHLLFDQLEGRFGNDPAFRWEGQAWLGTDENRVRFRSEGFVANGEVDDGQQELFYSRAISTFFDAQVGARYDLDSKPGRGWGAFGIEGLAPLFFHVAATGYVSSNGLAAKLEGSYDLLITQRLILQPQIEMNFYSQNDPARGIGSGLSDLDAGLRLRYEVTRKIAPYIGVSYTSKYGATADYARSSGTPTDEVRFVVGLRTWL